MADKQTLELRWLTIATFEFRLGEITIISDPCVTDSPGTDMTSEVFTAADLIFLTHIHWDHILDLPDLVRRFAPKICLGRHSAFPLAKWLNCNAALLHPMSANQVIDFSAFSIQALPGRHTDIGKPFNDSTALTQENPLVKDIPALRDLQGWGLIEFYNFLLTTADGLKILFWGGNPSPDQVNLLKPLKPDLAIMQFSRQDPQEIAQFACAIGVDLVIPHHMDLYQQPEVYQPRIAQLQDYFRRLNPAGMVLSAERGKWYSYEQKKRQLLPS